jgi:hypothetical protein
MIWESPKSAPTATFRIAVDGVGRLAAGVEHDIGYECAVEEGTRSRTSIKVGDLSSRSSVGTENSIPKEMNHREIAVRVPVMNEVQLLFPSEPRKLLKSRSLYVVFFVKKDVRVERRRTSNYLNHEEIERQ